jgi:hypothetical protein
MFDEALAYTRATQDLVRRARAGVASRLSVNPGNEEVHHAVKVLTLPAHVIVGVLDRDHNVSQKPLPQVISEFVESIHEQPRPVERARPRAGRRAGAHRWRDRRGDGASAAEDRSDAL